VHVASGHVCREQSARLCNDAVLKLRVAHLRRAEHRLALLVVVDAGPSRLVQQGIRDDLRGPRWSAPVLDERGEQPQCVLPQEAQEEVVRTARTSWDVLAEPIDAVARLVGFGSPNTFRDHFTDLVGANPTSYRRSFKGSATPTPAAGKI
jgi:AraC-like DNA-binding protein